MPKREKIDYVGSPAADLYAVWVDGKWRVYISIHQANVKYLKALEQGKPAQLLRYEMVEIIGENGIQR